MSVLSLTDRLASPWQVLMTAAGRYANTKGLGLDKVGIKTDSDGYPPSPSVHL
jgi:pyruvate/2-oxoglutarate dehydrogenase complex dihydrolipoamide dehydrogenase (E3) component